MSREGSIEQGDRASHASREHGDAVHAGIIRFVVMHDRRLGDFEFVTTGNHERFLLPGLPELVFITQAGTARGDFKTVGIKRSDKERDSTANARWPRLGCLTTGDKKECDAGDSRGNRRQTKLHDHMNGSATVRPVLVVTRTNFFANASAASFAIFGQSEGFASIFSNNAVVSLLAHSSFFQICFPSRPTKVARAAMMPPSSRPLTGPTP